MVLFVLRTVMNIEAKMRTIGTQKKQEVRFTSKTPQTRCKVRGVNNTSFRFWGGMGDETCWFKR